MIATQDIALKNFFRERIVIGSEFLPKVGPVLLAPTHRARWDGLMLTMAAGRRITGRDSRFMVTLTEMKGIQGWFLERLGCFPIDQRRPSLGTLRFALDLMLNDQQLVVFPEGQINRSGKPIKLKQGLARLAQLAYRKGVDVPIIPVGLGYSEQMPSFLGKAAICFAEPIKICGIDRDAAKEFNLKLAQEMDSAERAALCSVGRTKKST